MLSFLIPVFNYDCTLLVRRISQQAQSLQLQEGKGFDFEIIVADDASTDTQLKDYNRNILQQIPSCRYIELGKNAGRAAIRNFLVRQSSFEHLVFIDCDAEMCSDDFVCKYWNEREKAAIVCGSLKTPSGPATKGRELRYMYERKAESRRTAAYRQAHPFEAFTTFNVLMNKRIFEHIKFDERCTEYGYEDALLGLTLGLEGFSILHIDNPLIHAGMDTNISFLEKTETALRTLHKLGSPMQDAASISRLTKKLERWRLKKWVARLFPPCKNLLRRHLTGRHPSLLLFQLYKLGYYCSL